MGLLGLVPVWGSISSLPLQLTIQGVLVAKKSGSHKRVFILLAHGFEEMPVVYCLDRMREAGLPVSLVGLVSGAVRGAHGLVIEPDYSLDTTGQTTLVCGVVIPGGQQCISLLMMDPRVYHLVQDVTDGDGFLAVMATAVNSFNRSSFNLTGQALYLEQGAVSLTVFVTCLTKVTARLTSQV